MTAKKNPAPGHRFTVEGKTFSLPPVSGASADALPGEISYAAIMEPENEFAQLRLALAMLEAAKPTAAALAALKSLPTAEMLKVVGDWMGESSGSSD